MKMIEELVERYPQLYSVKKDIFDTYKILEECYLGGKKVLLAGNGGSSADADHIVGELMKGFKKSRELPEERKEKLIELDKELGSLLAKDLQGSLPAMSLGNHWALTTAYMNDVNGELVYAQQVNGYGVPGDVFFGISTSGNSQNILYAAIVAKEKGMKVIGLTGGSGGKLAELADVVMIVPEFETYKIQELHLPIYHCLCLMLEEKFFYD